MSYEAFVLNPATRQALIEMYPPKFPEVIGHHITHVFGGPFTDSDKYGLPREFQIAGYACEDGLEAFVVKTSDGVAKRPDGKLYHLTWSLDRSKGKKPVDSNALIAKGYARGNYGFYLRTTFQLIK